MLDYLPGLNILFSNYMCRKLELRELSGLETVSYMIKGVD